MTRRPLPPRPPRITSPAQTLALATYLAVPLFAAVAWALEVAK